MKGFKTELNNVPSFIYYQNEEGSAFEQESPIQIEFFRGNVCFQQGNNSILINDDFLEDFFKQVKLGRKEADKYLEL